MVCGKELSGKPKIVIAHDTRFFSPEFSAFTAKIAAENGVDACVFDGPRSTPEPSSPFILRASAGIVITASHNPPHDNGYKVYFDDGAQVIEPHASGIIAKVNAIEGESYELSASLGEVIQLGAKIDQAYMQRLETLVLDREMVRAATLFESSSPRSTGRAGSSASRCCSGSVSNLMSLGNRTNSMGDFLPLPRRIPRTRRL